jgi:DHA2 family multidrug resistance protein-like MFS transporter
MSARSSANRRDWIGLFVLAIACLVYSMDLSVLNLAVPKLSADLRPSSTQLLWILDIYGFFVAGSLLTMGSLGDRIGRRRLLLLGACAFGAASLLAAVSVSPLMLIVSRALLGIAGATLAPSTLSLIFHMFADPRERSVAIGVWVSSFSAGGVAGPLLGGILLEFFWWGSVFLLALPVMAVLIFLGPRVLPEFRDPSAGRLDLISAVMSIVAVLAVIFGLKQIAQDGAGPMAVSATVAGLLIGTLWVWRQQHLSEPMIDLSLFRIRTFNIALAISLFATFVAVGYFFYVAQYLQLVLGLPPLQAGVWSLPAAAAFILGSQVAPRMLGRVERQTIIGAGLVVAAAGLAILTQIGTTGEWLLPVVAASAVVSLGLAPVFALTTELIIGSAPPERAGAASGISNTALELGGALGIAVLGSIGVAVYRSHLGSDPSLRVPTEALSAARDTLGAALAAAAGLPNGLGDALRTEARTAFVAGVHVVSLIAALIAVVLGGLSQAALSPKRRVQTGQARDVQQITSADRSDSGTREPTA